jgi:predicted HicB family RNase H-like nuclease
MSKKITTIRAEDSLFEDLKAEAVKQGRSFNNLVTLILAQHIEATKQSIEAK